MTHQALGATAQPCRPALGDSSGTRTAGKSYPGPLASGRVRTVLWDSRLPNAAGGASDVYKAVQAAGLQAEILQHQGRLDSDRQSPAGD